MDEPTKTAKVATADGHDAFAVSVKDAQAIEEAFQKTGQDRLVWVTVNHETDDAVRIRLNVDQVVYIANA